MNKLLRSALLLFFVCLVQENAFAASKYWVGGSGNWNDPLHWSATSGGQGGAGVPLNSDDVFFDALSFTSDHNTIALSGSIEIHDFNFSQSGYHPRFTAQNCSLIIRGNWNVSGYFRNYIQGEIIFDPLSNAATIKTGNVHFRASIRKSGHKSVSLVSDDLELEPGYSLFIDQGVFNTNGKAIKADKIVFGQLHPVAFNSAHSTLVTTEPIDTHGADLNWISTETEQLLVQQTGSDGNLRLTATCGTAPNQFTITASVTTNYNGQHVSCNGADDGEVCVTVTGGIGPFDIQWLGGGPAANCWSGLGAGTYTIRVIDQGPNPDVICATTVTIVEPGDLTVLSWATTDPSCNNTCDGTASPFVFGGTSPYTFTWSSGETGPMATQLCVGLNTMNVTDANGCSFDTTFFILTPLAISPNLVATDATCFGVCDGTVTSVPTGGNGAPYTFSWSNGGTGNAITGLCAGNYSVTVFDANNCPQNASITVTEPLPIVITLDNLTNLLCNNICSGSISISASSGTAPYSYQWYNSPSGTPVVGQNGSTASGLCAGNYYVVVTDAGNCSQQSPVYTLTQPTAIVPATSATDAVCHNECTGVLTSSASGGTPPYSFNWINASNGSVIGSGSPLNGVCPGTYFAEVTDGNGCIINSTPPVDVNDPPPLLLVVDPTDAVCHDDCNGTALVTTATGGTGMLTVSWEDAGGTNIGTGNTINALCAGNYFGVLTDANGCEFDTAFVINEPAEYSFSLNTTPVSCINTCNGTATLSGISGESSPYTIDWSSSANSGLTENGLCAGTYSFTITDANGCDTTQSFTIANPVALILNPSSTDPTCSGATDGTATADPSGGTGPYTFSWFNQPSGTPLGQTTDPVTSLGDGEYSVIVTDALGCTATANYTLTDPVTMTATATSTTSNCGICDGTTTVTITGGASPLTIVWVDANTSTPTGETGLTALNVCAGNYFAMITDANGCTVNSNTVAVTDNVIITANATGTDPSCFGFCNGSIDLNVSGGTPPFTFAWFDQVSGNQIGQSTEDVTGLCEGTYYVEITDVNGCSIAPITISLNEPTLLTLTGSGTDPNCSGVCNGTGSGNPSGGTAPYAFSWVDVSTGAVVSTLQNPNTLCEGEYELSVTDAGGCVAGPVSITLTAPPPVDAVLNSSDASCFNLCDGSATLTVIGGTGPFTASWSSGANTSLTENGLCDGTYTVSLSDANGCTAGPFSFTIEEPQQLTATVTDGEILCNGDCNASTSVTASGGTSPYTYQWNSGAGNQTTPVASGLCAGNYSVIVTDANGCTIGPLNTTVTEPGPLTGNITSTNASCSGVCDGTATVIAAGGVAPYVFSWNDPLNQNTSTALNLCGGNYTATITDANGCVLTPPAVTINEPSVLALTASSVTTLCYESCDGSATVNINGGTAPFTILWDDPAAQTTATATGLCEGSYTVEVSDANGCSGSESVVVNEATEITATLNTTQATCSVCDGTATVNANGGAGNYTIQWDVAAANQTTATATALCAGAYNVVVTDANGCSAQFTTGVSDQAGEQLTIFSTDVSCNGGCNGTAEVAFTCSDPPCTIEWNDGSSSTTNLVTNLCAGTYAVTVTNNTGCVSVATIEVNEPDVLEANPTFTDVLCFGNCNGTGTVVPSGGTAPYTVLWDASASNQTTSTAFNLCIGTYSVTVTDANGCTDNATIAIDQPAALTSTVSSANASCYASCNGTGTAFPAGGVLPYSYQWDDPSSQVTQQAISLCAGQYNVTVFDANGCTFGPTAITITEPDPFVVQTTASTLACNGDCNGTATANVSGGTTPYQFAWNDPLAQTTSTANNLCEGAYEVSITDVNGCVSGPHALTLAAPDSVSATFITTTAACEGDCNGSIFADLSGGTLPYSLTWNDPANTTTALVSNLCAGNYELDVTDANGCHTELSATLPEPVELTINLSASNVSCYAACNGSVTATVSGGTAPYSYSWSNGSTASGINGLCPGMYSLIVTDANGCTASASRNITEPAEILLSDAFSPSSCGICNGTVSVSPSGGTPPFTYQWDAAAGNQSTQSANNLCAGIYAVAVTDANGCSVNTAVALSDIGAEDVTINVVDATCFDQCNGSASAVTACTNGPCSFTWFDATSGNPIGQNTATATNLCAGDYFVQVSNQPGCITIASASIVQPDEIVSNASVVDASCNGTCNGSISIAPSGGTGVIAIQWDAAAGNSTNATVSGLCSGNYVVSISDASGCVVQDTFVVNEPLLLQTSLSASNIQCNGNCDGTGISSVDGGTAPYVYAWSNAQSSPSATGLCAGNYSLTVTDANGCTSTASINITEPQALTAGVSSTDVSCFGDCSGTATALPGGGTAPYSFLWDDPSAQSASTATGLCAGNYSVIVGDANNCATAPMVVVINEPAVLDFTFTTTDISCNGNCNGTININAIGGTGSYLYSIDGGLTFQNSSSFSALCAGAYTLVVQDAASCISPTQNANINGPTAIQVTTSFFPADCNVNNGAASVFPSGGTPGYTFNWYDASMTALGQNTQTLINVGAGIYTAEITDANGCVQQVSVTVNNTVSPSATGIVTPVNCNGACNGAIDATANSGTAPYTYFWIPGGEITEDISGLCAGGYTLRITDANGCIGFTNFSVTQPAAITASIVSSDSDCGQCNGSAQITASGGSGVLNYDWSNGQNTAIATGLCAGAYMVQVTDNNGCTQTFNTSVDDIGGPTGENVLQNNVSCNGLCDGDVSVSPIGGTAPYSYYWVHNGATSNSLNGLCAGTYFLEVVDTNGCVRVTDITITEPPVLEDSVVVNPPTCGLCDGSLQVFPLGGTGPFSYLWDAAAGSAITAQVSNLCQGIYNVAITDANGCTKNQTLTLNGITGPQISVSATGASCQGVCDGTAASTINLGTGPFISNWLDENGLATGQNGNTATGLCAGDYILQVEDAAGCSSFAPFSITEPDSLLFSLPFVDEPSCFNTCDGTAVAIIIEGTLPYTFSWDDPSAQTTATASNLCAGTYVVSVSDGNGCVGTQTVVVNAPDAISVQLDSTDASCSTVADGAIATTASGGAGSFVFSWTGPNGFTSSDEDLNGIYTGMYQLTITDANGCSLMDSIFVGAILVVDANAGSDTSICAGAATGITLNGSGGITYEWYDMSGTLLSSVPAVTVNPQNGTTSYILVANNNGCLDSDTIDVSVNTLPFVSAGPDVDIVVNTTTSIGGSPTTSSTNSVVWVPSSHLSDSLAFNPIASPDSSTTYVVFATDANGCVNSDTMRVEVFPDITFPNGFSPNADGKNDVWVIDFISLFPECQVEVYNRWGQLLFLSVGYNTPWDGTFNNQPVPVGTYYYIINLNNPLYPDAFTGPLTVLR